MDVMIGDQLLADQMNGTVRGGVSLVAGVRYNAASFNGINGYIYFGRHDGCLTNPNLCITGITWSLWVNFRSHAPSYFLTSGAGYARYERGFSFSNPAELTLNVKDTGNRWMYTCQAPVPLNKWLHLAATWHDGTGKIYLNGVLQVVTVRHSKSLYEQYHL